MSFNLLFQYQMEFLIVANSYLIFLTGEEIIGIKNQISIAKSMLITKFLFYFYLNLLLLLLFFFFFLNPKVSHEFATIDMSSYSNVLLEMQKINNYYPS